MEEYARGTGQGSNYAAKMNVQNKLRLEDYVCDMEQCEKLKECAVSSPTERMYIVDMTIKLDSEIRRAKVK
jgi:galactitol-specific phosphotransferase system IIB component